MNIGLSGWFKTVEEIKEVLDDLNNKFYREIKTKKPSIASKIYHFKRRYLYDGQEREQLVWGEGGSVKTDEIDQKILQLLTKNIKLPATEIAQAVGLTSMAVINRIKRLEKEKIILGYRCALNLSKLGYTHQKIELYIENLSKKRKETLFEYLRTNPHIVYIVEVLDTCDLEFEMQVKSLDYFYGFMQRLRQEFPEIKKYQSHTFHKEVIVRYIPKSFCQK